MTMYELVKGDFVTSLEPQHQFVIFVVHEEFVGESIERNGTTVPAETGEDHIGEHTVIALFRNDHAQRWPGELKSLYLVQANSSHRWYDAMPDCISVAPPTESLVGGATELK